MISNHGNRFDRPLVTYPDSVLLACCLSIATYNVIEISILIFTTFKRYRGLYFWSFVVAAWSILFHVAGHSLKLYRLSSINLLYNTLILTGWIGWLCFVHVISFERLTLLRYGHWTVCLALLKASSPLCRQQRSSEMGALHDHNRRNCLPCSWRCTCLWWFKCTRPQWIRSMLVPPSVTTLPTALVDFTDTLCRYTSKSTKSFR